MSTIIRIKAHRTIQVTSIPALMQFKVANEDLSTTEPGSLVTDQAGNIGTISNVSGSVVTYFNNDVALPLVINTKTVVKISSIFRFATTGITIYESGIPFFYDGRLASNSVTESLGTFLDKNQVTSSSSIKLRNNDSFLSTVFHTYNLVDSIVDILEGSTEQFGDYQVIFSGVTIPSSGFTYSDSIFSFKAKDDRADLLNTPILAGRYLAKDFPKYAQYTLGSPIAFITLTAAAPSAWAPGTVIQKSGLDTPIATVVNIGTTTTQVYIYRYTGNFALSDVITGAGVSATVTSVTPIVNSNLVLKGDTGHFIGNNDDLTNTNIPFSPSSKTLLSHYSNTTWYGGFANYEPVFSPLSATMSSNLRGYLHQLVFNVDSAIGVTNASLTIITPNKTVTKPLIQLSSTGSVTVDLSVDSLQVFGGNITVQIAVTGIGSKETSAFSSSISGIQLTLRKRASASGSFTTVIPIDFGPVPVLPTGNGTLDFNTTDGNLVSIDVEASSLEPIANPSSVFLLGNNVSSGFSIPLTNLGNDINYVIVTTTISPSPSFLKSVDVLSTSISYPLADVIGTTLPSSMVDAPKPIVYGDFSTVALPTVLLTSTKSRILNYTFDATPPLTGPNTGSMHYSSTTATEPILMGDSITFVGVAGPSASSGETVIAKVTQVIGTFISGGVSSGDIYFEDLGIVPGFTAAVTVSRVTNIYKVSASPLQSISGYEYKPKSGDGNIPLPNTASVVQENLVVGEFTITGINPIDEVFVKCKGKPDAAGILIEDPVAILEDISNTYLKGATISVDPTITTDLSALKLRRYLNNGDVFSIILQDIQKSTNTASFIATNNAVSIFRYNSTIVPSHTFYEDQVKPGSFEEQYDPRHIQMPGASFSYNYDTVNDNYLGTEDRGVNSGSNTLVLPWIYRTADAALIADDTIDFLLIPPEVIHTMLVSPESYKVNIGDIVSIIRKDTIHDIIVTQYIKNTDKGTIELYGIDLSNKYSFGYPMPTVPVFPQELIDLVGTDWSPSVYTSTPSYLNNPYWDDNTGAFSSTMGFYGLLNTDNAAMSRGVNTSTIDIITTGNARQLFYTNKLIHDNTNSIINFSVDSIGISAGTGVIYFTSILYSSISLLTGDYTTDAPLFNSNVVYTFGITTTPNTNINNVTMSIPPNSVVLVYIQGTTGSVVSMDNILLWNNKDYNATVSNSTVTDGNIYSYKQWNTNWPLAFKDYVMSRFMPVETLPNLTIVSSLGDVEPMNKSRVIQ